MHGSWHALLALICQQPHRCAQLARELTDESTLSRLCASSEWRPSGPAWALAARQVAALRMLSVQLVPAWELPARLRRARPPAPALFVRGEPSLLAAPAIAIVGARAASPGPLGWARRRAAEAAAAKLIVASGGARGIDAAAHDAVLCAGGTTVAFLGVGAGRIYPTAHRVLFERILRHGGAIVSEHPPLARCYASAHAMRNRFIAAHADRLLVAEAAPTSGSLGTAGFARGLGVPVLVPPDDVGGERSGIIELLRQRHARVMEHEEVLR
jgi:DNA processing protein